MIVLDGFALQPGPANDDGFGDLTDYTVCRNNLGSTMDLEDHGEELGVSQGIVDQDDYHVGKKAFGNVAQPRMLAVTTVPEPRAVWPGLVV